MSTNLVDRYYKAFNNGELNYLTRLGSNTRNIATKKSKSGRSSSHQPDMTSEQITY